MTQKSSGVKALPHGFNLQRRLPLTVITMKRTVIWQELSYQLLYCSNEKVLLLIHNVWVNNCSWIQSNNLDYNEKTCNSDSFVNPRSV